MTSLPSSYRKIEVATLSSDFRQATRLVESPLARPGPGEILVRNRFLGVNGSDAIATSGGYGLTETPFDIGLDSAGTIVAVGEGVTDFAVGEDVLVFAFGGGYAEYRKVSADQLFQIPRLSAALAAAFIPALTASVAFDETGFLRTNETVLVTAAAGGVGSMAVQLARLAGNRVIGTTSDDGKAQWLKTIGCEEVLNYRREDLDAALSKACPNGVNVVFETVGRSMFDLALRHLALFGRLLTIGATSEYGSGIAWEEVRGVRIYQALMGRSAVVAGAMLANYPRPIWIKHLQKLVSLLDSGRLQSCLDPTPFKGLESVADAVSHVTSGRNRGKVMVEL